MIRGVVRALVSSKLKAGIASVLVVTGALGGGFAMGVVGSPSVAGVSNHFGSVSEETTTINTELSVDNPNPIGVGLDDVNVAYAVDMNDVRIATGEKDGVSVGSGNSTVPLETRMQNGKIPAWWVSHLRNGEHSDLVVHATVTSGTVNESVEAPEVEKSIDTDIASSFNSTERRPIEADKEPLVSDPVLYVEETSGWWGSVSEKKTTIQMRFEVHNPKSYAIPVQEVKYDIGMNGIDVGSGGTERSYVIQPGETKTVAAELTLNNDRLDEWWVSHLERNQVTDLTIDLSLVVDLSNAPGGGPTVTVPVDTIEHQIDTDLFGNKAEYPTGQAAANGTDGDDNSAETGTATATETDGGSGNDGSGTSTPTPIPTSTPTPTPTPTDTGDGLLESTGTQAEAFASE